MCPSWKMQEVAAFLHRTARELSLLLLRKEMVIFFSAGLFNVLMLVSGYRFLFVYFLLSPLKSLKTDVPILNLFFALCNEMPFNFISPNVFCFSCPLCFLEGLQGCLSLAHIIPNYHVLMELMPYHIYIWQLVFIYRLVPFL